jgi:hypothetical protein
MPISELKLESIEKRSTKEATKFPNLYHYTSLEVLNSMLFTSHELWFHEASFMNDSRELLDYISNLDTATSDAVKTENMPKHHAFFKKVYSEVETQYPCILSFSRRRDDAAQWERYADNAAGVCIKFNTKNLAKMLYSFDGGIILQEVFYRYDPTQLHHFEDVKKWIDEQDCTGFLGEDGLISNIIATSSSYKHTSFEAEDEVRAIILFAYSYSNIHFEQKDRVIKKIIKLNFMNQCQELNMNFQDLFDEIIIGPKSKQNVGTLKEFFIAQHFYSLADKVKKSECPLR